MTPNPERRPAAVVEPPWLESIPHGSPVFRAALERDRAETHLRDVVAQARDRGATWGQLARVTGIPQETLRRRYG